MTNPEVFFNAVAGIASSPEAAAIRDDYLRAFLVEQILVCLRGSRLGRSVPDKSSRRSFRE